MLSGKFRTMGGIFGTIQMLEAFVALIGSRETWKISVVRVGKEGDAPLRARFLPRLVQGFSRASLETREEMAPSFFSAKQARAKRKGRKMARSSTAGARRHVHAFSCYGGKLLQRMGASWFVSYAYHKHVDAKHLNWNRVATKMRVSLYDKSFSYPDIGLIK